MWYFLSMDNRELDPFSTREKLSVVLPAWVVTFCGPYFDEVGSLGHALIWLKWILVITIPTATWLEFVDGLVPEQQKTNANIFLVLLGVCGVAWSCRMLRRRDAE
jgi:hypothetical protein